MHNYYKLLINSSNKQKKIKIYYMNKYEFGIKIDQIKNTHNILENPYYKVLHYIVFHHQAKNTYL